MSASFEVKSQEQRGDRPSRLDHLVHMRKTDRSEPAEPVPNYRAFTWSDLHDSCRVVTRFSHRSSVCSVEGGATVGSKGKKSNKSTSQISFLPMQQSQFACETSQLMSRRSFLWVTEHHQEGEKTFNGIVEVW